MSNRYPGEIKDPETGKVDLKEVWYKVRSAFAVLLSLAVFVGGGWFIYSKAQAAWMDFRTAEDYIGEGVAPVEVTIPAGSTTTQIASILVQADVVKTAKAFTREAAANPDSAKIQAGRYNLRTQLPAKVALAMLLDPKNQVHNRMTLREGLRLEQAVTTMSKASGLPAKDFTKALKDWKKLGLPNWAERGAEGFLFPDTYELPDKPTTKTILKSITDRFNQIANGLDFETGAETLGYSPYEVLVMASIIEKEAGPREEDRAKIARVFYNRLEQGMQLQSDATVAYANNVTGRVSTTAAERKLKSPYNTYYVKGLPVGPIASPSKASMDAALHPADGDWLYFAVVNLDTGETEFNADKAGHDASVAKWRAWCAASDANKKKCFG
ncbi:Endolytic murein transglycosylase [Propionicimonas sp. T2.31MG-18]|uniref:endolytic transglycosylase MltG n=1 Tax=Propionicimonas sp. T2.31MG-18 TaxID=3157620 RepID=UPI0035EBB24A